MSALSPPRPYAWHAPQAEDLDWSLGGEAVDLARTAGLDLDPWQDDLLRASLARRPDGRWAAVEVGACVPRQNGKGTVVEARQLAGLFIIGDRLTTYSAHQFDTSLEAFNRLLFLIEDTPELEQEVMRVSRSHGDEGIYLRGRRRIRFRTRTGSGGRGFSGDTMFFDEAMILRETMIGALVPTLSARENPQLWYLGSAVDQTVHEHGVAFARIRERGLRGEDPLLAYIEFSAMPDADKEAMSPSAVPADVLDDHDVWARANPGLGVRVSEEFVGVERQTMDPRTFAVERLGIGDWPDTTPASATVIDLQRWRGLVDTRSEISDGLVLAFDVTPERSGASISAAGIRADGLVHVEVIDRRSGTRWIPARLAELRKRHQPRAVVCDGRSPAGSLVEKCADAGVTVEKLTTEQYVESCGAFFDLVDNELLRHLGGEALETAIRGAAKRPLVDAWAWSRKGSTVDITPLVSATIAAARSESSRGRSSYEHKDLLVLG